MQARVESRDPLNTQVSSPEVAWDEESDFATRDKSLID